MVETLAVGVSLSYYERSQNDGAEGSQSALWSIWSMVRAANSNHRPSTKLPARPRASHSPRRVRRASTSPSTARKWAYGRLPCAAFRAVAWRARAPVGRRPLFGRGASRRRKRGRRQRERAMSPWETLCLHVWRLLGGWRPNGGTRG